MANMVGKEKERRQWKPTILYQITICCRYYVKYEEQRITINIQYLNDNYYILISLKW